MMSHLRFSYFSEDLSSEVEMEGNDLIPELFSSHKNLIIDTPIISVTPNTDALGNHMSNALSHSPLNHKNSAPIISLLPQDINDQTPVYIFQTSTGS